MLNEHAPATTSTLQTITLTPLVASSSCTPNCWNAIQETCRCTCHGRNHGIFKTGSPTPPPQPAADDDTHYQLTALLSDAIQGPRRTAKPTRYRAPSSRNSKTSSYQATQTRIPVPNNQASTEVATTHRIPLHQHHIDDGRHRQLKECPVALAIKEYFHSIGEPQDTVHVLQSHISLSRTASFQNSQDLTLWLETYDHNPDRPPKPFILVLDFKTRTAATGA